MFYNIWALLEKQVFVVHKLDICSLIAGRIDDMGSRIDDLEKALNDLMAQVNSNFLLTSYKAGLGGCSDPGFVCRLESRMKRTPHDCGYAV